MQQQQEQSDDHEVINGQNSQNQSWFVDQSTQSSQNLEDASHAQSEQVITEEVIKRIDLPICTQTQTKKSKIAKNTKIRTVKKCIFSVLYQILRKAPNITKKFLQQLRKINLNKNNSISLKFIDLARQSGLIKLLRRKFCQLAKRRIQVLGKKNLWTSQKFQRAQLWRLKIQKALKQDIDEERFETIWERQKQTFLVRKEASLNKVKTSKDKLSQYKKSQLISKK